jgi:Ca-activated chloride channel homolog
MPEAFFLLLIIPLLLLINNRKRQRATLVLSHLSHAEHLQSWKNLLYKVPFFLRLLAIVFIVIALARPQTRNTEQSKEGEGIDIVLCIDVSGSMTAQDFKPNRIEAAKRVAADFVDKRNADRIGIVIFSGESFTQCPLTTDYDVLKVQIQQIRNGLLEDGTSIGSGLATSVDRLRNSKAKSKVVILMTDGVNNGGLIDPNTAKEIAKGYGVKVYTIGIGSEGYAPTPINTPMGIVMQNEKVEIDEKLLQEISSETGGKYFRATGNQVLQNVYNEIDKLEKSKVQVITYNRYIEKFYPFILISIVLLLIEAVMRYTVLRKFP